MTCPAEPADLPDPDQLRELAVALAREVGALILDERPADLHITGKSNATDLVTVMDKRAESHIAARLAAERPDDGILGEEGNDSQGTSGIRWIVDPIDGTVNYAYGRPDFSVSIAAVAADTSPADVLAGHALAGAVFDARTRRVFHATRGGGAFDEDRPLRATAATDLAQTLIATGYSYDAATRARQGLVSARLLPQIANIRRIGSAALDLCGVAAGTIDGYAESDLSPWDCAAGSLIAVEAGARVRTVALASASVTDDYLVVAAPGVVDALAAAVRG